MNKIIINTKNKKSKINKNIYGHFSEHLGRCIYEGLYVGKDSKIPNVNGMRSDVVEALKKIKVPVLRWPGGCFADEYHWKDGIGTKENRKKIINTHWGGTVEDNSFGTHEFMELCNQLNCEPYINANVGSGTVQEMSEWVEYLTFDGLSPMAGLRAENGQQEAWRVKYWGVGNENWGCGGNMRPEYYADLYRRFSTYCRNYGANKLFKIACGPSVDDYNWTEQLMRIAGKYTDAITLHHYTVPTAVWNDKGSALEFDEALYYNTLYQANRMEDLIINHLHIMNKYDPEHKVGLIVDEWGTWHNVEPGTNPGFLYQQNTMRDAIVAAMTLDIFNNHSERVIMANIAQTVNVLQAVVLTEGEKMLLTPTYHVFDMYKVHQDATLLESFVIADKISVDSNKNVPGVSASSSITDSGEVSITTSNLSCSESLDIEIDLSGFTASKVSAFILSGKMHDYNDFGDEEKVNIKVYDEYILSNDKIRFTAPPCAIILFTLC